jgi:hypothetical protein
MSGVFTEAEKREVLRQYLLLGSVSRASEATGVAESTIKAWRYNTKDWWDRTVNELVTEMEGDYRPNWVRVMGKAVEAIEDRLTEGDERLVGKERVRVKVSAKDASVIAGIAADKLKQFGLIAPAQAQSAEERRQKLAEIARQDRENRTSVQ